MADPIRERLTDVGMGPTSECSLCPRLAGFRHDQRLRHPAWHNAPVPSFGSLKARLLVVGLAPGLSGANATGRPFTGDGAGALLYPTLLETGFARGTYDARPDDGLILADCRITNAVRCVPPGNRPLTGEIGNCRHFLDAEIAAMRRLSCIVTLGAIAHRATLASLGIRPVEAPFAHGRIHHAAGRPTILSSYHCSRLNTNTGRLTASMFKEIFEGARSVLERPSLQP